MFTIIRVCAIYLFPGLNNVWGAFLISSDEILKTTPCAGYYHAKDNRVSKRTVIQIRKWNFFYEEDGKGRFLDEKFLTRDLEYFIENTHRTRQKQVFFCFISNFVLTIVLCHKHGYTFPQVPQTLLLICWYERASRSHLYCLEGHVSFLSRMAHVISLSVQYNRRSLFVYNGAMG